jgi:hypothetical protein
MKNWFFLGLLGIGVASATWAAHPNGLGVGGLFSRSFSETSENNGALSLKIPQVPIHWGIAFAGDTDNDYFSVSLTGDVTMKSSYWVREIKFGYFVRLGAYGRFSVLNDDFGFSAGARLPIGVQAVFFNNFLELFIDVAPTLGIGTANYAHFGKFYFPDWSIPVELGIRVWF